MAGRIIPSSRSEAGRRVRRQERRFETAQMAQCRCGSIAKLGEEFCGACITNNDRTQLQAEIEGLETLLFHFYQRKYTQRADERQKQMGLVYTNAETHDLAKETARFILTLDLDGCGDRLKIDELREALKDV